jgi:hypothetical protein
LKVVAFEVLLVPLGLLVPVVLVLQAASDRSEQQDLLAEAMVVRAPLEASVPLVWLVRLEPQVLPALVGLAQQEVLVQLVRQVLPGRQVLLGVVVLVQQEILVLLAQQEI